MYFLQDLMTASSFKRRYCFSWFCKQTIQEFFAWVCSLQECLICEQAWVSPVEEERPYNAQVFIYQFFLEKDCVLLDNELKVPLDQTVHESEFFLLIIIITIIGHQLFCVFLIYGCNLKNKQTKNQTKHPAE